MKGWFRCWLHLLWHLGHREGTLSYGGRLLMRCCATCDRVFYVAPDEEWDIGERVRK